MALIRVETAEELEERLMAEMAVERKFREANEAFLESTAARDDIKMTESGLLYEVLTEGTGPTPAATDKVRVHYAGTLIDGTEFDSSHKRGRPAEFAVNGVIKGWQEALQLMPEGSVYRLVIPSELAYGERSIGEDIRPGSVLVFEVELLEIL
ncbi:MAG: FKBP-type peptidyl-prolyl cis-trans isomerase [Sphingomonadales bacterium]